ncbi:MAG TPA: DUF4349 domain-containing protein [Mycobacteriales bacterium]|nr:DUF4349 domain-containing protein [Mycobacteriales bacterium]
MTDTELLIRDCLSNYAEDAELTDLVAAATAQSRQRNRAREARYDVRPRLPRQHRLRFLIAGAAAVVIAFVAVAFAVGGNRQMSTSTRLGAERSIRSQAAASAAPAARAPSSAGGGGRVARSGIAQERQEATPAVPGQPGNTAEVNGLAPAAPVPAIVGQGTAATSAAGSTSGSGSGVTATRVVKTGTLALRVARGQVQATVSKLVALTTSLGGYVSQSRTDNIAGSPEGDLTLRMPVGKFETAVSGAEKLGHETSLTTDAHDVTGRFVDLNARLMALQHTRSTYLTILGHATTIGSTLEVQDRINGVQSQIEQLQGEIKVLRNQSADGTLRVDVTQPGAHKVITHPHAPSGISKAWHNSTHRFSRGVDAIVGALGPILLALLVLAFFAAVAVLGRRLVLQRG